MTPAAMADADIRWQQRVSNTCRAFVQLEVLRAMGGHTQASDMDLLLPWPVEVSLRQTLPEDLPAAVAAERSTHG